jgi:hypothetical protein
MKNTLIGQKIPNKTALPETGTEILGGFSSHKLQVVFRNWIQPDQGAIDADGGYRSD